MDKLKHWAKMCNFELDFDHIKPWTVKDPGLGYKDYCNIDTIDTIDALRYGVEYLCKYEGEWKGEQKMGTMCTECFGGANVNGALYYRDDDGNFVKIMEVTNIEETTDTFGDSNSRAEIKVDGYAPWKSEKIEVNNTSRRMLGSISEKYSLDNHVFFMIFDGTDLSVKINRTVIGRVPDYSYPYTVTVYDAGHILWRKKHQRWHDLECTFMYDVASVLNAWFPSIYEVPKMLKDAERVVLYTARDPKDLDKEKARMEAALSWAFKNGSYLYKVLPVAENIDKVIFDNPATVILWKDGTRTVVHAQDGEPYDKEKGFAMAVCKKIFGNERDYYHVFKRWFRKGEDRSKKEK